MSLAAASRSEYTKLFTTAMWWLLGLILVVYLGLMAAGLGFVFGATKTGLLRSGANGPLPAAGDMAGILYSLASTIGYVFPLLIGTLMVTGEFRHRTLTPTFLTTPRRGRVLAAKVAAGIGIGVVYAIAAIIATVGAAAAMLAAFGLHTALDDSETWVMLARLVLAFVLWVLVGLGVGALVRNQVAAIVIVLAFTQFVEPVLRFVGTLVKGVQPITDALPGSASDALVGHSFFATLGTAASTGAPLQWWAGGLILLGYAVVLLVLGQLFSWRRDVS